MDLRTMDDLGQMKRTSLGQELCLRFGVGIDPRLMPKGWEPEPFPAVGGETVELSSELIDRVACLVAMQCAEDEKDTWDAMELIAVAASEQRAFNLMIKAAYELQGEFETLKKDSEATTEPRSESASNQGQATPNLQLETTNGDGSALSASESSGAA
jgi:hypothetical protein